MIPFGRDEHVRFSPLRSRRRAAERAARLSSEARAESESDLTPCPSDGVQRRFADRAIEAGDRKATLHTLRPALGTQGAAHRPEMRLEDAEADAIEDELAAARTDTRPFLAGLRRQTLKRGWRSGRIDM